VTPKLDVTLVLACACIGPSLVNDLGSLPENTVRAMVVISVCKSNRQRFSGDVIVSSWVVPCREREKEDSGPGVLARNSTVTAREIVVWGRSNTQIGCCRVMMTSLQMTSRSWSRASGSTKSRQNLCLEVLKDLIVDIHQHPELWANCLSLLVVEVVWSD